MDKIDLSNIGKRIQARRKQLGYTQEQLAEIMNVSIQMVSNLERGNKAIRIDNLVALSEILSISTDYILTGKENSSDIDTVALNIASLENKDRKALEVLLDYYLNQN